MLDLAISIDTDRAGTSIVETNNGVLLRAPDWPQDSESRLVAFTPSSRTCEVVWPEELVDDIRKALAALEDAGTRNAQKTDWHRRLRRYAKIAKKDSTDSEG